MLCKQMYDYAQLYKIMYDEKQLCDTKQDYANYYAMMMCYVSKCMIMYSYSR